MKSVFILAILALLTTLTFQAHLRKFDQNHEFLDMLTQNPLQIANLMSGNWAALLPEPIRTVLNLAQGKLNPSGFLSSIQNRIGGNGGLFGGMGNLFGQSVQGGNQGLGSLLQTFAGATQSNPSFAGSLGLPQIPGLSQFTGGFNPAGALSGLTGGINPANALSGLTGGATSTGGGILDTIRSGLGV